MNKDILFGHWLQRGDSLVSDVGDVISMTGRKYPSSDRNGYQLIKINNKYEYLKDVVWELFNNREVPTGYMVDHINQDKEDMATWNLYLTECNIKSKPKGTKHKKGTFNKQSIIDDIKCNVPFGEISAIHGCSYQYVWNINKGLNNEK